MLWLAIVVAAASAALVQADSWPVPAVPFDEIETNHFKQRRQDTPPFVQPLPGLRQEVQFVSTQGLNRTYVVYVPSTLTNAAAPLVFSYHGFGSTPRQQELLCFFSSLAEDNQFIAVYPEGTVRSHNSGPSCCPPAYPSVDDVQNAKDIIAHINGTFHPVDRARVYSTGMSNGGYMSTRLACDAADVFAAVANVAGANPWPDMGNCQPSRPIPYLHFHGDADPTVDYDNAQMTVDYFLTAVNNCNLNSDTITYQNGDSTCVAYSGCAAHGGQGLNNVTFCTTEGGLHGIMSLFLPRAGSL